MSDSDSKTHRACAALSAAALAYPDAWKKAELYRSVNGQPGKPHWHEWCYLPLGGWYAIVAHARHGGREIKDLASLLDVSRLAALGAWRMGQGIFQFESDWREVCWHAGVSPDCPAEALLGLPQWGVYLVLEGLEPGLHGVWAHLEHDANSGAAELRLLLDEQAGLTPLALDLGAVPLAQSVAQAMVRAEQELQRNQAKLDAELQQAAQQQTVRVLPGIVALLAQLCDPGTQFWCKGELSSPSNPEPRQTRHGQRLFAAAGPTVWRVGRGA